MSRLTATHISRSQASKSRNRRPGSRRLNQQADSPVIHPLLQMQQTHGNRAVGRMIQAQLKVSQPGDKYEQEADRVSDQVMRMTDPKNETAISHQSTQPPAIQRLCPECEEEMQRQSIDEEEKKNERLQMQAQPGQRPTINPNFQARITGLQSGGRPLQQSERAFFEPRFSRDFSQVRVHTDGQAADTAKSINARAFTIGRNIAFGAGEFAPGTTTGRKLLAHELTHVVQQTGSDGIHIGKGNVKRDLPAILRKEETRTSPTFIIGDVVNQNTRNFANCNGVTLQGHTDANYSNSFTAPGSSTPSQGCPDCSEDDGCVTNKGTVISVFNTNPQISLPLVPSGLNECERIAVQNFINTTLRAHERQHVAAFNSYRGTVKTSYKYKGCASGLDAHTQQIHDQIERSRKARADNASAALDANGANIFTVTCKCPDPLPDAGTGTTP